MSASRLVLAAVWIVVFFHSRSESHALGAIAVCCAASDILDGYIARRMRSTSHFGRWVDNTADIVFILAALACEAYAGAIPAYLPALVAVSFAQYALDSVLVRHSAVPVKSRLGHWAGIFNYILVIVLAWAPPLRLPVRIASVLPPLVGVFYLAAICERALFYRMRSLAARKLSYQQPVSRCS